MPTIEINDSKDFLELTRVYKMSGKKTVKSAPITIAVDSIASVRPSNRLGKASHRSTIVLNTGSEVELAETYSTVTDSLSAFAA